MAKKYLFWKDTWMYDKPLSTLFSDLFKLCMQPNISVHQMKMNPQSVRFTRCLIDDLRLGCDKILETVDRTDFMPGNDMTKWKFGSNGYFTVKSVYKALTISDSRPNHKKIWKGKIPVKIKIFLWLVTKCYPFGRQFD
jgi:hypothetical protein